MPFPHPVQPQPSTAKTRRQSQNQDPYQLKPPGPFPPRAATTSPLRPQANITNTSPAIKQTQYLHRRRPPPPPRLQKTQTTTSSTTLNTPSRDGPITEQKARSAPAKTNVSTPTRKPRLDPQTPTIPRKRVSDPQRKLSHTQISPSPSPRKRLASHTPNTRELHHRPSTSLDGVMLRVFPSPPKYPGHVRNQPLQHTPHSANKASPQRANLEISPALSTDDAADRIFKHEISKMRRFGESAEISEKSRNRLPPPLIAKFEIMDAASVEEEAEMLPKPLNLQPKDGYPSTQGLDGSGTSKEHKEAKRKEVEKFKSRATGLKEKVVRLLEKDEQRSGDGGGGIRVQKADTGSDSGSTRYETLNFEAKNSHPKATGNTKAAQNNPAQGGIRSSSKISASDSPTRNRSTGMAAVREAILRPLSRQKKVAESQTAKISSVKDRIRFFDGGTKYGIDAKNEQRMILKPTEVLVAPDKLPAKQNLIVSTSKTTKIAQKEQQDSAAQTGRRNGSPSKVTNISTRKVSQRAGKEEHRPTREKEVTPSLPPGYDSSPIRSSERKYPRDPTVQGTIAKPDSKSLLETTECDPIQPKRHQRGQIPKAVQPSQTIVPRTRPSSGNLRATSLTHTQKELISAKLKRLEKEMGKSERGVSYGNEERMGMRGDLAVVLFQSEFDGSRNGDAANDGKEAGERMESLVKKRIRQFSFGAVGDSGVNVKAGGRNPCNQEKDGRDGEKILGGLASIKKNKIHGNCDGCDGEHGVNNSPKKPVTSVTKAPKAATTSQAADKFNNDDVFIYSGRSSTPQVLPTKEPTPLVRSPTKVERLLGEAPSRSATKVEKLLGEASYDVKPSSAQTSHTKAPSTKSSWRFKSLRRRKNSDLTTSSELPQSEETLQSTDAGKTVEAEKSPPPLPVTQKRMPTIRSKIKMFEEFTTGAAAGVLQKVRSKRGRWKRSLGLDSKSNSGSGSGSAAATMATTSTTDSVHGPNRKNGSLLKRIRRSMVLVESTENTESTEKDDKFGLPLVKIRGGGRNEVGDVSRGQYEKAKAFVQPQNQSMNVAAPGKDNNSKRNQIVSGQGSRRLRQWWSDGRNDMSNNSTTVTSSSMTASSHVPDSSQDRSDLRLISSVDGLDAMPRKYASNTDISKDKIKTPQKNKMTIPFPLQHSKSLNLPSKKDTQPNEENAASNVTESPQRKRAKLERESRRRARESLSPGKIVRPARATTISPKKSIPKVEIQESRPRAKSLHRLENRGDFSNHGMEAQGGMLLVAGEKKLHLGEASLDELRRWNAAQRDWRLEVDTKRRDNAVPLDRTPIFERDLRLGVPVGTDSRKPRNDSSPVELQTFERSRSMRERGARKRTGADMGMARSASVDGGGKISPLSRPLESLRMDFGKGVSREESIDTADVDSGWGESRASSMVAEAESEESEREPDRVDASAPRAGSRTKDNTGGAESLKLVLSRKTVAASKFAPVPEPTKRTAVSRLRKLDARSRRGDVEEEAMRIREVVEMPPKKGYEVVQTVLAQCELRHPRPKRAVEIARMVRLCRVFAEGKSEWASIAGAGVGETGGLGG